MKKAICLIVLSVALYSALSAQTSVDDLAILNRMMRLKMQELIPLRFVNALDGKPIDGATVVVSGIGTFTTDMQGIISFPEQDDGFYTLEFSKTGFITSRMEFEVKLNNVFRGNFAISPVMQGDYLRIVLDWGQSPSDLDLHLVKEGVYHISYWNMHNAADGSVTLDRDTRNGFGPETITVMRTDINAVYIIYVHDYSNNSRNSSREMSQSGATVRIFGRNGIIQTFRIPENRAGNLWEVFRIVNGQIVSGN